MAAQTGNSRGGTRPSLEAELAVARNERDQALGLLSDARAEVNALRMVLQQHGAVEPRAPVIDGGQAFPLRYRLADAVNDAAKRLLGPVHTLVKRLSSGGEPRS